MATTKNITMKQFNGTDYDTLYPKTVAAQIDDVYSKSETYSKSQLYTQSQLYTRQQILSDTTKTLFGLGSSAIPDDVLSTIKQLLDSKSRIAIGSYIGTGGSGESNPNSLNFDFEPSVLIILYKGLMSDSSGYSYSMIATKTRTSVVVTWGADGSDTSGYRTTSANKFAFSGKQVSWYVEKDNPNWNNYYEAQFNDCLLYTSPSPRD